MSENRTGEELMGLMVCNIRVFLNMTNEKALEKIDLEDLKKFAVDKEL